MKKKKKKDGAIYNEERKQIRVRELEQARIAQEKNKNKISIRVDHKTEILVSREDLNNNGKQFYIDSYNTNKTLNNWKK